MKFDRWLKHAHTHSLTNMHTHTHTLTTNVLSQISSWYFAEVDACYHRQIKKTQSQLMKKYRTY
jgi:hypothetical protein